MKKKRRVFGAVIMAVLTVGIIAAVLAGWIMLSNRTFVESFYTLYSYKLEEPVRAVVLSDLHQKSFGKGNEELIARIDELEPDVILIAGDVVNKKGTDINYAIDLCRSLTEIAPVYYGLGNHENEVVYGMDLSLENLEENAARLGDNPEDFTPLVENSELLDLLEEAGVTILQNTSVTTEINNNKIVIGGVSTNVSSFWPNSGKFIYQFAEEDGFKILISHRPDPVMNYISDYDIDLAVSGHNHGGIIRIPGRGGLISADEGFFPKYDSGAIGSGKMTMVISRGLGGHGLVPRIFNPPELVIIDIR